MRTVDIERTIEAPIADVFDWLTDATNYPRVPLVRRVTLVRPGDTHPQGRGAVRLVVTPVLRLTEEIVEYHPPTLMCYRILQSIPTLRHEQGRMEFRETANGTRVRWLSRFELESAWSGFFTAALSPGIALSFHLLLRTAARDLQG
ncbi:SRPBCC family protein [Nocardia arthritidis]|uniref:SRPBCC family protein n=1 Tax=Nocardia arthritidis TaxID=228602 RepID=A0A6G9YRT4_9NOCA|nr:SRPBCC family protein [Nocardia arthritidis]QIS15932.1 SRPBCC family protein [Nocardia arthritidis]